MAKIPDFSEKISSKLTSSLTQAKLPMPNLPSLDNIKMATPAGKDPDTPYEALQSLEGWNDNPLMSVRQPTYKITLFMTEDVPFNYTTASSYEEAVKAIKARKRTVIAESGVSGLNIQSLEIRSNPGPTYNGRSMSSISFEMIIKEPMGVSFMDMLANTAKELRIKNYAKTYYFLEVRFQGYSEDGSYATNPCADYANKGVWLYQLHLNSMDSDFTAEGSTYIMKFMQTSDQMLDAGDMALPFGMSPEGRTVKQILDSLALNLNKAYEEMYTTGYRTFEFRFLPFIDKQQNISVDPGSFRVSSENEGDYNPMYHWTMTSESGDIKAHFGYGAKLHDIVELTLANSQEAQKLAKAILEQDKVEEGETNVMKVCKVFRVVPTVEVGDYDYVMATYRMKYIFTVMPYETQLPIIARSQIEAAKDPKAQAQNVMALRKANYLCKRYDYLFTGRNTSVLNLEIKYNTMWAAILPRIVGFGNSTESTETYAKYKSLDAVAQDRAELARLYSQQKQAESQLQKLDALTSEASREKDPTKKEKLASQINELEAKKQEFKEIAQNTVSKINDIKARLGSSDVTDLIKKEESRIGKVSSSRDAIKYAEDIINQENMEIIEALPVSMRQTLEDTKSNLNGAFPDNYNRDRSIYGAVLDQLYAAPNNSLQNLSMEIVGDPYWLGVSGVERNLFIMQQQNADFELPKNRANFDRGDILFLLSFKYPYGFDDETGNASFARPTGRKDADGKTIIKDNEVFTGVYTVKTITHKFDNGQFRQTVNALRLPLIHPFRAFAGEREQDKKK